MDTDHSSSTAKDQRGATEESACLTFTIEGLAKIRRARVTWAKLMLFVGPNNTGKSFLSMLIWGLHRFSMVRLQTLAEAAEDLKDRLAACFVAPSVDPSGALTPQAAQLILPAGLQLLEAHHGDLLKEIFNHPVTLDRLALEIPDAGCLPPLSLRRVAAATPNWRWEGELW